MESFGGGRRSAPSLRQSRRSEQPADAPTTPIRGSRPREAKSIFAWLCGQRQRHVLPGLPLCPRRRGSAGGRGRARWREAARFWPRQRPSARDRPHDEEEEEDGGDTALTQSQSVADSQGSGATTGQRLDWPVEQPLASERAPVRAEDAGGRRGTWTPTHTHTHTLPLDI